MIHLSANDTETLRHLGRVTIWQPAASHFSVGELVPTSAGPLRVESVSPVGDIHHPVSARDAGAGCSMSRRQHSVFGVLEKPAQPRPSHEQLADELHHWLAQGGRIKQLPSGKQTGQDKGKAK